VPETVEFDEPLEPAEHGQAATPFRVEGQPYGAPDTVVVDASVARARGEHPLCRAID
jgi:hypothetical protein